MAILGAKQGKINFLRVHDAGGWGPPSDFIDVECVIRFLGEPDKAYGFQLRVDPHGNAHSGMLDIVRDAFNHDWEIGINYWIEPDKKNGIIIRVWLVK